MKIDLQALKRRKFGKLTVSSDDLIMKPVGNQCASFVEVTCDCGNKRVVRTNALLSGRTNSCTQAACKSTYTGLGDLSGSFWYSIVRTAQFREIPFQIDKEFALALLVRQGFLCAISGLPIAVKSSLTKNRKEQTASLDRIDNSKGYVKGNVQWVHKELNRMKGVLSQRDFITLCTAVVAHNRKESNENHDSSSPHRLVTDYQSSKRSDIIE